MIDEIWKDVSEFPDLFMISNHGRVWSERTKKILTPTMLKTGYYAICSKIGGRQGKNICRRIHRWVATAFILNPENKLFVNHMDGNKTNNRIDNLVWCTSKENCQHAWDTGLSTNTHLLGENNHGAKLKWDDIEKIKESRGKISQRKLGKYYGVSHTTIGDIQRGYIWLS